MVDDKENSDSKGSQEYASKNAASFLFGLLDTLEFEANDAKYKSDKLLNIFCKLYPEGVKDNNIFKRAGGDLSRIKLSNNGYIQWYDAIELINNGGSITLDSLINKAKEDFPSNEFLWFN